jgi:hypothetical protein
MHKNQMSESVVGNGELWIGKCVYSLCFCEIKGLSNLMWIVFILLEILVETKFKLNFKVRDIKSTYLTIACLQKTPPITQMTNLFIFLFEKTHWKYN